MEFYIIASCLAGLVASGILLAAWLRRLEDHLSLIDLNVFVLMVYHSVATLWPYLFFTEGERRQFFALNEFEEVNLLVALLLVFFFAALLLVAQGFGFRCDIPIRRLRETLCSLTQSRTITWFFICFLGFQLSLAATGKIGFQGIQIEEGDYHISPLASFCLPVGFAVMLAASFHLKDARRKWLASAVIGLQLCLILLQGRRLMACGLGFALLGLCMNRPSWRILLPMILVSGLAIGLGFRVFVAIRAVKPSLGKDFRLVELVREGLSAAWTGVTPDDQQVGELLKENLSDRPIIISYLAQLTATHRERMGTGGQLLINALVTAIPSKIFPYKVYWMLEGAEEDVTADAFGQTDIEDSANTIMTAAYSEGREMGVIAYVVVTILFFSLMILSLYLIRTPWFFLLAVALVLFQTVFVETGLIFWFGNIRSLFLFAALDFGYRLLTRQDLPWMVARARA